MTGLHGREDAKCKRINCIAADKLTRWLLAKEMAKYVTPPAPTSHRAGYMQNYQKEQRQH